MDAYLDLGRSKYWPWARPLIEEPKNEVDIDSKQRSKVPWTALFLVTLSILGVAASTVAYIQWRFATTLASVVIWAVAILALTVLRPRTFSFVLCVLYVAATLCEAATLTTPSARHGAQLAWNVVLLVLSLASLFTVLNMQLRHPFASRDGISKPYTQPTSELRSPEDNLTMWQWMTVAWLAPLIANGSKRQLHNDDVWQLPYHFQHTNLHIAFKDLTGSVVVRLLKANWIDLLILTVLGLLDLAANYSVPLITQRLLRAMQSVDKHKSPAVTWALLILVAEFVTAQSAVFSLWYSRRAYERSRGAMVTMLHDKVLHRKILGGHPKDDSEKPSSGNAVDDLSPGTESPDEHVEGNTQDADNDQQAGRVQSIINKTTSGISRYVRFRKPDSAAPAKEPASMGKILNLMRNDVYEVSQRFWEFQTLLNAPLGLLLSLVLVWRIIGWPSLIGIAVVILSQVITVFLAKGMLNVEKVRRKATDYKLQQTTQYIEAIRHLRWYGWHLRKIESLISARQKELILIVKTRIWGSSIAAVNMFASGILPVASFWAYTKLAGQDLTVDIIFPALQVFTLLQANLQSIPQLVTVLLNASVAVGRIRDFMDEPDVAAEDTVEVGDRLELKNASFAWPGLRNNVLHRVAVSFPPGLSIVVGSVASGKTALLQALLGELDLREGRMLRPETSIGYCAQTPWLESMTIRENILFCSPYDETRYKHVLDACALLPDLASFPQGDRSAIGENGIGLSGGQKARVALARALYSQSTILLLDDPLSALDQQTAEWIVSRCFTGSLIDGRTFVLVTHRVDLCQGISEQVVELEDGRCRVYQDTAALADGILSLSKVETQSDDAKQAQEAAAIKDKFEDEEHRAEGGLKFRVYWEYIKAGKLKWWTLAIIGAVLWRLFDYGQTWFLKEFGEAYRTFDMRALLPLQYPIFDLAQPADGHYIGNLPDPKVNPDPWLFWYTIIVFVGNVPLLGSHATMITVTYTAGKNMFQDIMHKISNATFRFYDVTPIGRLMNRLTGDISTIDGPMSSQLFMFAWESIAWTISLVVIATVTPIFTVVSIAMAAVFVYVFRQFLPTSQSLRRLEFVSLSPLMSNFGALLAGLMTVRAFRAQSQFQDRVIKVTDAFQKMDHFYWSLQSWLTYRFQVLSAFFTLLLTLLAIYSGLTPGSTAFVLVAAQKFVQSTYKVCKQYGNLQLDFVSVERIIELIDVVQEDPGSTPPPAYWPLLSSTTPAVEFENVTVRYAPHFDPALKDISFTIPSGASVAIIGRTGSGKSTLALSLLATIQPDSGRILVDGIDISKVTKQELRSRVTFLAQDPILFQGTIRSNLDPMEDYSEAECTSVLERIHGHTKYGWNLDTLVDAGGKNLSQGQRQLVGLARAILRRSAVIIMDEATASVDLETSWEIQRVLKEELAGSTVITIAHRASAVRDCDLVVRLDKGTLAAFGTPAEVEMGGDAVVKDDSPATEEMTTSNETTVRADSSGSEDKTPHVRLSHTSGSSDTQVEENQNSLASNIQSAAVSSGDRKPEAITSSTFEEGEDRGEQTKSDKAADSEGTTTEHSRHDRSSHSDSQTVTEEHTSFSVARSEDQTSVEQITRNDEESTTSGSLEVPGGQQNGASSNTRRSSGRTDDFDMVIF